MNVTDAAIQALTERLVAIANTRGYKAILGAELTPEDGDPKFFVSLSRDREIVRFYEDTRLASLKSALEAID